MKLWLSTFWKDEYLVWDPNQFFNITSLTLTPDLVWLPDLVIVNSKGSAYNEQFYKMFKSASFFKWRDPVDARR